MTSIFSLFPLNIKRVLALLAGEKHVLQNIQKIDLPCLRVLVLLHLLKYLSHLLEICFVISNIEQFSVRSQLRSVNV